MIENERAAALTERERFERHFSWLHLGRHDLVYDDDGVDKLWQGWCVRAALTPLAPLEPPIQTLSRADFLTNCRAYGWTQEQAEDLLAQVLARPPEPPTQGSFHLAGLSSEPSSGARASWQPIATAPKDGTYILLGCVAGVWIGKYLPVYVSGYVPGNEWASMMLNHDHMAERRTAPTHWMPLPEPPVLDGAISSGPNEQSESASSTGLASDAQDALEQIAFMGLDCPAAAGPATDDGWYRSRAHACIGIAARALATMKEKP